MRLDHLLSTEFFRTPVRRPSCGPCAGDRLRFGVGVLVWKRSLASRVLGAGGEWYGYAFGFPDRHPTVVSIVARFRCPCGVAGVRWTRGGTRGAWRFENWIVDASKRNMVFLFAYRDFAKLFFLSLVSRSIIL